MEKTNSGTSRDSEGSRGTSGYYARCHSSYGTSASPPLQVLEIVEVMDMTVVAVVASTPFESEGQAMRKRKVTHGKQICDQNIYYFCCMGGPACLIIWD